MDREKALVILMRIVAAVELSALVAALMPLSWMAGIHEELGLGELPKAKVVEYLARSTSIFYAHHGAMLLFLSFNVRRWRNVILFGSFLGFLIGALLLTTDLAIGMPAFWTAGEGPTILVLSALVFWLARGLPEL